MPGRAVRADYAAAREGDGVEKGAERQAPKADATGRAVGHWGAQITRPPKPSLTASGLPVVPSHSYI